MLYGESGSGKTSLAAHFDRCGFICDSQERGITYLVQQGIVPEPVWIKDDLDATSSATWTKLLEEIWKVARDTSIDTLVVESLTGLENICFLYHGEQKFNGDFSSEGFYNRWKGPKNAARFDWPHFMDALDGVLQSGKNVIVTAHSQVKEDADPQGTTCIKYMPYSEKDTWARLHRWASAVFYLGQRIEEDKKSGGLRKIAKEDYARIMFVSPTPYCSAKNWYGLNGVVPMGDSGREAFLNLSKRMGW